MEIQTCSTPACKRNLSLSSNSETESPNYKKPNCNTSFDKMNLEESINQIQQCMLTLSTKEDIRTLREEVRGEMGKMNHEIKLMSDKVERRCDELEERCSELEDWVEKAERETKEQKKENDRLKNDMRKMKSDLETVHRDMNDIEQYSRRNNVRVFNLKEEEKETVEELSQKVCKLFSEIIQQKITPEDFEACHRLRSKEKGENGEKNGEEKITKARQVLVKLKDRKIRDRIMLNKKNLKGRGVSVGEDLTAKNAKLSTEAFKHSATLASWTMNGQVFAKLKNGRTIRLKVGTDVDKVLREYMS